MLYLITAMSPIYINPPVTCNSYRIVEKITYSPDQVVQRYKDAGWVIESVKRLES